MQFYLIQHVGKLQPRYDNVMPQSRRVWPTTGSVVRIPEDEALHYLNFPETFTLASPSTVSHELVENLNAPASVDLAIGLTSMFSIENQIRIRDALDASINKPEPEVRDPLVKDLLNQAEIKKVSARIQTIAHAISRLDPTDGDSVGQGGKPKVGIVKEMTGIKDVTMREIEAAMAVNAKAA